MSFIEILPKHPRDNTETKEGFQVVDLRKKVTIIQLGDLGPDVTPERKLRDQKAASFLNKFSR